MVKPYNDNYINSNTRIREFSQNTDKEEFVWHMDKYDRKITIINGNNWKLQYDDEMPILLEINKTYYIPKNTYHRIIKGNDDLIISIIEDTVKIHS